MNEAGLFGPERETIVPFIEEIFVHRGGTDLRQVV